MDSDDREMLKRLQAELNEARLRIEELELSRERHDDDVLAKALLQAQGRTCVVLDGAARVRFAVGEAEALFGQLQPGQPVQWNACREDGEPWPDELLPHAVTLATGKPVHEAVMRVGIESAIWVSVSSMLLAIDTGQSPCVAVCFSPMDMSSSGEEIGFGDLVSNIQDGCALYDVLFNELDRPCDCRFLQVNPAFEQLTGLRAEDVVGRRILQIFPELDPSWLRLCGEVVQNGIPQQYEGYSSTLGRDYAGTVYRASSSRCVCLFRDRTDQKRKEEEQMLWASSFRNAEWGIGINDVSGRFLLVNRALAAMHGYAPEEMIGMRPEEFLAEEELARMPEILATTTALGTTTFETRARHRDGGTFPVQINLTAVLDDRGTVLYRISNVHDITERRQSRKALLAAKEAAEAANTAKDQFLANMSHELRTPLNGIMGMLQLLLTTRLGKTQQDFVETALESSRRLTELLSDILDLTRIESGITKLRIEVFQLGDLLRSVEDTFRIAARRARLKLSVVCPDPFLHFHGDELRIRQVLSNLVGNALKFTDTGSISLSATLLSPLGNSPGRVLFVVSDTGCGISDDSIDMAFDRFSQLDGSYTRLHQGAGLGLSIVRQLVQLMGGNLAVESHLGTGTTFYVSLPLAQAPTVEAAPDVEMAATNRFTGRRALIADDDKVSRIVLTRFLELRGVEVHTARDGAEALKLLGKADFDVVFMDVQMPVMDGMQAISIIRSNPDLLARAGVIVVLTAHAMRGDRERFLEGGADECLTKPVTLGSVEHILETLLQ